MLFPWLLSACSGTPVPISLQHTGTSDTSDTSDTSGTSDPCLAGGTVTGTIVVPGSLMVIGNEAPTEDPKPVPAEITASAPGQPDVLTDADATGAFTLELTPGHPWVLDPVYDQIGGVDTGGAPIHFSCLLLEEPVPVCSADLGAILLEHCMTLD